MPAATVPLDRDHAEALDAVGLIDPLRRARTTGPTGAAGSRPILLGLQDGGLPLSGQVLEAVRVQQRLVKLPPLGGGHLEQWRIRDRLLDAAAQLRARHRQSVDRKRYSVRDVAGGRGVGPRGLRSLASGRLRPIARLLPRNAA